jgi:hypothetical protein
VANDGELIPEKISLVQKLFIEDSHAENYIIPGFNFAAYQSQIASYKSRIFNQISS